MSSPYNYQIFPNVATIEDVLGNIKLVASSNGWTIDKDDIATNQELYLHNTGNGSQNLYFSLKGVITSTYNETNNATRINTYGNTGFDAGAAVNAQPGKYSNSNNMLIQFPIINQYILANNTNLVVIFNFIFSYEDAHYNNQETQILPHLFIGALDTYKDPETEGNFISSSYYFSGVSYPGYDWHSEYLDCYFNGFYRTIYINSLFYNGIAQNTSEYKVKIGIGFSSYLAYSVKVYDYQYPRYDGMVKYNTTVSRTTLIKPIIYLDYSDETDAYDYPIGEVPYYACQAYPYSKAGDIIIAGTRKFMVFPLLQYTDSKGVAFEVNP